MRILRALADALVATLLVVACESVAIAFLFRRELAGPWEMRQALRILLPITWATTVPVAMLGALILAMVISSTDRRAPRIALTVFAAAFGVAIGLGVSQGRHLASWAIRAPFVLVVTVALAALVYALSPRVGARVSRSPALVASSAAIAIVLLLLADLFVLPHLYPPFHEGLAFLAVLLSPWLALAFAAEKPSESLGSKLYVAIVPLLAAAAIVFTPSFSRKLVRADNVRFLYGERAPIARYATMVVAAILPPESAPKDSPDVPEQDVAANAIDLRGRDVVLISVDALRADHVGAYGYAKPITPQLDALAKEGARFEHAYCATPHTSYSVTSMMTGKYMRPLLREGAGEDSDTIAKLLRTYGYRTAGFYPPAVFFIDAERFTGFRERGLDFEYRRVEFASGAERAGQVTHYLERVRADRHVLLWVHLFEPHEPYDRHPEHDFGDRDIDRYDGEIAAADDGIGAVVRAVREKRPQAAIIVTADHGEEFGDHGGRYHGTSVYEEQVRVPLVIVAPGIVSPRVIAEPVQTIDLLPTVLSALRIPRPARIRGRDLTSLLATSPPPSGPGLAYAETDETTLLADGSLRLVCARRLGACQLYDLSVDAEERHDVSAQQNDRFVAMRRRMRDVEAAHGRFERAGLRAEGGAWPEPIRRGIAGDGDAAADVAALLDDADATYRRKAAEVLFELAWPGDLTTRGEHANAVSHVASAPLSLALTRDEDDIVRRWSALALTRLGEGASRSMELVEDKDPTWRRLAALALAESGDPRGEGTLVAWWQAQSTELPFERARQIVAALGKIKSKRGLVPLMHSLGDLRLRPFLASALANIGESAARPSLLDAFSNEHYVPTRFALGNALIALGAGAEMAQPLARFLGTPDPLPDGLSLALRGDFLPSIGGPDDKHLARLTHGRAGVISVPLVIPRGGRGDGVRLIVRGRSSETAPVTIRIGLSIPGSSHDDGNTIEISPRDVLSVKLPAGATSSELAVTLPESFGGHAGAGMLLVVDRPDGAQIDALAVVPLADELPAPPPEPWTKTKGDQTEDVIDDGT